MGIVIQMTRSTRTAVDPFERKLKFTRIGDLPTLIPQRARSMAHN